MISVIMPYWNRLQILRETLASYEEHYSNFWLEIVIADDGSPEACVLGREYPWPIKVLRLPDKYHALNPCVPINKAVAASEGEIIVLTNPEVSHDRHIFGGMVSELRSAGPRGYVIAATWSTDRQRWYCHSSITDKANRSLGRLPMPEGSGLHFCTMMYRRFFDEIGGFDESYRDGQGVEDNDFLWKLHAAGAIFRMRDDLVVSHRGTATVWPPGGIERNSEIYRRKWG